MSIYLRSFLIIYFYFSIILAAIDSFNNFINNFKLKKYNIILFICFPITFIIETFIIILYKTYEKFIGF